MKKENKNFLKKIRELLFGKTIIIKDDFFGDMTDAGDYYECRRVFKPTGKIVEIGLEKKNTNSNEKQIIFFTWLENNYDLLIEKISPSIEKEVAEWIPNYQIRNFKKEFILEYLYIPKCDDEIFEWEISFYADNELQHWCSLNIRGTEVKNIMIDG